MGTHSYWEEKHLTYNANHYCLLIYGQVIWRLTSQDSQNEMTAIQNDFPNTYLNLEYMTAEIDRNMFLFFLPVTNIFDWMDRD